MFIVFIFGVVENHQDSFFGVEENWIRFHIYGDIKLAQVSYLPCLAIGLEDEWIV